MRLGEDLLDNPVEWGRLLIQTKDHDPLYSALIDWTDRVGEERVQRFMLTYWCCYSVGASWFISKFDKHTYWTWLLTAAHNEFGPCRFTICDLDRWPRAHERRHWRGQKCEDSVKRLRSHFPEPESAINIFAECDTLEDVEKEITQWPQFGPWIAFKAADMLECVLGWQIKFPESVITLYRDPRKGAEMAAEVLGLSSSEAVVERLLDAYDHFQATSFWPRQCNIQEVETVLCKWKSARGGHYWIGKDTQDHRAELLQWGAHDLLRCYPSVPA